MGFSWQESRSGLLWPPPEDLPNPWIQPKSRDWTHISYVSCIGRQVLTTSATWEAHTYIGSYTHTHTHTHCVHGVLSWLSGKESACQRNQEFDPWVGKITWRRNLLQHSCLEKPMNKEAWWAMVHRVTKSQPQLSDWAHVHPLCVSHIVCVCVCVCVS